MANQIYLFALTSLLSSLLIGAREIHSFNKIPSTTNDVVSNQQPNDVVSNQQPNFLPQNDDAFSLYGKPSDNLPPSSAAKNLPKNYNSVAYVTESENIDNTANSNFNTIEKENQYKTSPAAAAAKYLPKNYNPVAYVTEPEEINESTTLAEEKPYRDNNFNTIDQQEKENEYKTIPAVASTKYLPKNYNPVAETEEINESTNFAEEKPYRANNFNTIDQQEKENEYKTTPATAAAKYLPKNYNSAAYVTEPEEINESATLAARSSPAEENFYKLDEKESVYRPLPVSPAGINSNYQGEGMSDTRSVKNGMYFYDTVNENYSRNHPYQRLRGGNVDGNNVYEFNGVNSNQEEVQYRDEELP